MGNLKMEKWLFNMLFVVPWFPLAYLQLCASLNEEGRALLAIKERIIVDPFGALSSWQEDSDYPCLWFGVECSDNGQVVALKLRDLSLEGMIAPEIGELTHIQSIILRNNSFSGVIPVEIGKLKNLELLDLGYNNLSGPLPSELGNASHLKILIVGSNRFACSMLTDLKDSNMLLKNEFDEELLLSNRRLLPRKIENATLRRLLSGNSSSKPPPPVTGDGTGADKAPIIYFIVISLSVGVFFFITVTAAYFHCYQAHKAVTVMPWTTGLSEQLQNTVGTGVPSLRRLELEIACEQFSNIIASLPNCTLYKGTLSSGVEIAVTSTSVTSAEDWSEQYEAHFRNKISTLCNLNHKNFMNLLGYCMEEEPFTRMMVFEYAPNGTLFEHLHIKEAEQLDWAQRVRVAMGIAYCLQKMEQLNPPLVPNNLSSSSIYLTEDYAAKISDLEFWSEEKEENLTSENSDLENIVYKFGIILLEIISGRLPFSEDDGLLVLWATSYLNGKRPLKDMVDRTLESIHEEEISQLADVIRSCIDASPGKRPTMANVAERMRRITSFTQEAASPRVSPLWWAEVEIISQ